MSRLRVIGMVALALPVAMPVHAGGFYLPFEGTGSIGRASAGDVASADDASTIFANPAGMADLPGAEVQGGIGTVMLDAHFRDTGSTAATPGTLGTPVATPGNDGGQPAHATPVPNFFAAVPVLDRQLWFGVGVTAPFGLGLQYNPSWFGRYDVIDIQLTTIDVSPTVTYRVNRFFSIGGGLDVQYAKAKLSQALPNTLMPGGPSAATDGIITLRGDSFAVGGNVGILIEPLPTTNIGIHYRSQMSHDLGGTTEIAGLSGPLAGANGLFNSTIPLNLPDIVSVGITHQLTPRLRLLGEAQYFSWSRFNEIRVRFANGSPDLVRPENYRDSFAVSIGGEYDMTEFLRLRTGFMFDQTPTVDAFRSAAVPDGNRYWTAIGATYRFSGGWALEGAYSHTFFDDAVLGATQGFFAGSPAFGTATTNGVGTVSADTVALSLRRGF